jgi:hypothetical protein
MVVRGYPHHVTQGGSVSISVAINDRKGCLDMLPEQFANNFVKPPTYPRNSAADRSRCCDDEFCDISLGRPYTPRRRTAKTSGAINQDCVE